MEHNKRILDIVNQDKFSKKVRINVFKNILQNNLNVTNEKLLIIGDKGYKENFLAPILTNAYSLAANELNMDYETVYQNYKGRGDIADQILIDKLNKLPSKSVIVMNISNRIGNLDFLGKSFRKHAKNNMHRFVSSSSLGSIENKNLPLIIDCLDIDYEKIEKRTIDLQNKLTNASEMHIQTKAGTDVTIDIRGIEAKKATGVYRNPGEGGNLPGSEAYIAPTKNGVNGTFVVDGSIRVKNKTVLVKEPVKVDVKNGSIVGFNNSVESRMLKETIMWAHNKAKNPDGVWRIGEVGIGLNKKAKIIGSTIIDEKVYGTAHFAIGSNAWFGGAVKSIIHLDQVFKDPRIKLDNKLLKY